VVKPSPSLFILFHVLVLVSFQLSSWLPPDTVSRLPGCSIVLHMLLGNYAIVLVVFQLPLCHSEILLFV
jgi:hypothetical protein